MDTTMGRVGWRVAVLGWGSLVWDGTRQAGGPLGSEGIRDGIVADGGSWLRDGPVLPIEFARHSSSNKVLAKQYISLVIAEGLGTEVATLWAEMNVDAGSLSAAIDYVVSRLAIREQIEREQKRLIGRWPSSSQQQYQCSARIEAWAKNKGVNGVVWTALPTKWNSTEGARPNVDDVRAKLVQLVNGGARYARDYVLKAPEQIATAFRPLLEEALR